MVYLVGLLDVAHLKVEAAGGGQQGRLPLLHLHTLQQAQALDIHNIRTEQININYKYPNFKEFVVTSIDTLVFF
jgi:hypothetical protein